MSAPVQPQPYPPVYLAGRPASGSAGWLPAKSSGSPEPVLLHDAARCRELEAAHARILPPHTLMQRAGAAIARLALALAPHAHRIEIVAGPGNNGGDGFEAARLLQGAGKAVRVWWLGEASRQPDDARNARQLAAERGVRIVELGSVAEDVGGSSSAAERELQTALDPSCRDTLVIDALLGRGLTRPPEGRVARIIDAINATHAAVLAVDLPSGLNGDTGVWLVAGGSRPATTVAADWTIALLSPAPGLFTGNGRDLAGEIWWHDLGTDRSGASAQALLERGESLAALLAPRRHAQHKGSFGDVRVVGGSRSMAGAAWLAANAALQCGSGRVYVDLLDPAARQFNVARPELMLAEPAGPGLLQEATVVAGCGGGSAIAARLPALIEHAGRLVIDADGLNAVAAAPDDLVLAIASRSDRGLPTVLTPHPLEAARLLGCAAAQIQADRLRAAHALAERFRAIVVLKGSGTVVAGPDSTPSINSTGNAALATPGTGDVLAGCIAALWRRSLGVPPIRSGPRPTSPQEHALLAARAACHLHGAVAEQLSGLGEAVPAEQLARALGDCLRNGTGAEVNADQP